METNDRIALEKVLEQLRARVQTEMKNLDAACGAVQMTVRAVELQADKARNVAMEALSEIRNIRTNLAAAAAPKGQSAKERL